MAVFYTLHSSCDVIIPAWRPVYLDGIVVENDNEMEPNIYIW